MDSICVTAYKSPKMLSELLLAIENDFHCFVHVDKKHFEEFKNVIKEHPKTHFYSVYSINWGG